MSEGIIAWAIQSVRELKKLTLRHKEEADTSYIRHDDNISRLLLPCTVAQHSQL